MRSQPRSQSWPGQGDLGKLWKTRIHPLVPRCESSLVPGSCPYGKAGIQGAKPRECSDFQSGMRKGGRDLSRATGNRIPGIPEPGINPPHPKFCPTEDPQLPPPQIFPYPRFLSPEKELLTPRGCSELGDGKRAALYRYSCFSPAAGPFLLWPRV